MIRCMYLSHLWIICIHRMLKSWKPRNAGQGPLQKGMHVCVYISMILHYMLIKHVWSQVADVCRGMMADITALRAKVCQLEEEKRSLDQHLNLKHRERYDTLVRQLFSTCVLLKVCTFSVLTCRLKFNFDIIKSWTRVYVAWCQLAQLSVPPTVTSGQIPYEYGPRCATAGEQREEGRRGPNHQTEK